MCTWPGGCFGRRFLRLNLESKGGISRVDRPRKERSVLFSRVSIALGSPKSVRKWLDHFLERKLFTSLRRGRWHVIKTWFKGYSTRMPRANHKEMTPFMSMDKNCSAK